MITLELTKEELDFVMRAVSDYGQAMYMSGCDMSAPHSTLKKLKAVGAVDGPARQPDMEVN